MKIATGFRHHPELILAFFGAAMLILNITIFYHWLAGLFGLAGYGIGLGMRIGGFFQKLEKNERYFWGMMAIVLSLILANTAIYYAYKITTATTLGLLLIPLSVFLFKKRNDDENKTTKTSLRSQFQSFIRQSLISNHPARNASRSDAGGQSPTTAYSLLPTAFLITESLLFLTLFQNQTTSLLPSPWQTLSPLFFAGYAAATFFLFLAIQKTKHVFLQLALSLIHLFLTFSIAAIIYKLGFGFDAFIHRATEVWIQTHGFITPKTPYYIGQYSFVVWLSNITAIPIFFIDVYLVPILAALTLPPTVALTIKRVWDIPTKHGTILVWLIPFLPFFSFHLTTPHNLALLPAIIIVFAALQYLKGELPIFILILLALATLVIHPLIGSLIALFVTSVVILKTKIQDTRNKKQTYLVSCFLYLVSFMTIALALPTLFTILNYINGFPLPTFENPFNKIPQFLDLFSRPYWYLQKSFWHLEILYAWQRIIPVIIIGLGIVGFFLFLKKNPADKTHSLPTTAYCLLPITSLAFLTAAFLLRSWVVFGNVVSYEQTDFPLRILKASLIFLLPFGMYGMYKIIYFLSFRLERTLGEAKGAKWRNLSKLLTFSSSTFDEERMNTSPKDPSTPLHYASLRFVPLGMTILCSVVLTLSLYLAYPQRNHKSRFPGFNVTQADFDSVEWIHNNNETSDYIVLANQLVSSAALTKYSFLNHFQTDKGELFYYSIPTGGPLYQYYGKMLYEGQKREYMEETMALTGANQAYFVVNSYWANSEKIIEGAKKTADSWQVIDDGKVWIFVYEREL